MKIVFIEQTYTVPEFRSAYFRVPDDWDEAKIRMMADTLLDEAGEGLETGDYSEPEYAIVEDEPDEEDPVFTVVEVEEGIHVENIERFLDEETEGGAQ